MSSDKGIQLEISFEKERNRFREQLESGTFFVLTEINTPPKSRDFNSAVSRASDFEFLVSEIDYIPVALAVTDKLSNPSSWNIADFGRESCKIARDRHLFFISGRNSSLTEISDTLEVCKASGMRNIIPVSGDAFPGENASVTAKRTYTGSIHVLNHIKEFFSEAAFYPGGTANPFRYSPQAAFPQYFKLIKKTSLGMQFICVQAGWDLLKLQELKWYLASRGFHIPVIARLLFLSPDKVENIRSGRMPGIVISHEMYSLLKKEFEYSQAQFEAAQWRRLQILAAGCRLLGCSAVQVAGLESANHISTACRRIAEAVNEFDDFNHWKEAYHNYIARAEMAPSSGKYYMFDNLFSAPHPAASPKMKDSQIPGCSSGERLRRSVSGFLLAHAESQAPDEHLFTKKLLCGCRRCSYCKLPFTQFVCPEICPKKLANGPCGGMRPDGKCELDEEQECIHSKIFRLAAWKKQIPFLEEKYIPLTR